MERLPEFIGNHLFLVCLFIAILSLLLWNMYGELISGVKSVTPAEATLLINRDDAILIDTRSQSDFIEGHILNAKNISADELASSIEKLKQYKNQAVIIYCNTGAESPRLARLLMHADFERVFTLKGGLTEWKNANLPLTKKK